MIDPDQWFEENEANPKFNVRDGYGNFVRFEVQPEEQFVHEND